MGLLILQELGRMRQTLNRAAGKIGTPPRGVLFERITRREADDGLISCSMYFANYVFYKFGLEVSNYSNLNYFIISFFADLFRNDGRHDWNALRFRVVPVRRLARFATDSTPETNSAVVALLRRFPGRPDTAAVFGLRWDASDRLQ